MKLKYGNEMQCNIETTKCTVQTNQLVQGYQSLYIYIYIYIYIYVSTPNLLAIMQQGTRSVGMSSLMYKSDVLCLSYYQL